MTKRVRVAEHEPHDTAEAASSLLGFFTQLERNTSQEDMVHFFEGVQKNVVAASVASTRSPPKPVTTTAPLLPTSAFIGGGASSAAPPEPAGMPLSASSGSSPHSTP